MHTEQIERAEAAHQEVVEELDATQVEMKKEVAGAYAKSWYLPLLFWLLFAGSALVVSVVLPFASMANESYLQFVAQILGFGLIITTIQYLFFGIVRLFHLLRLRWIQLLIIIVCYGFAYWYLGLQNKLRLSQISDQVLGSVGFGPLPNHFKSAAAAASILVVIVASIWLLVWLAGRLSRK